MTASWLRIHEIVKSTNETVCVVARLRSINSSQRTLIIYDDDDYQNLSTSTTLNVSINHIRTSFDAVSPGQCVQIYGKVIRLHSDIHRIDAQFIRQLSKDFDFHEYNRGLLLTQQYMSKIDDVPFHLNTSSTDQNENVMRTIL